MVLTKHEWTVKIVAWFMVQLLVLSPALQAAAYAPQHRSGAQTPASAAATTGLFKHSQRKQPVSAMPASFQQPAPPSKRELLPVPVLPAHATALVSHGNAQQLPDAWDLFDGDATTGLTSNAGGRVRVRLELGGTRRIDEVAVFGPGEGYLSIYTDGSDEAIAGWRDVDLRGLSRAWHRFAASESVRAKALVIEWQPTGSLGPTELMFWGPARPRGLARTGELHAADQVLAGEAAGELSYRSSRAVEDVARISGAVRFPVHIDTDPRAFARAFLVYQLKGLGHFSNALRQINGGAVSGGTPSAYAEGGLQVEEIAPGWLKRGANAIDFLPLSALASAGYRVSDLRVVALPHASTRRVAPVSQASPEGASFANATYVLPFETPTQPETLFFDLLRPSKGTLVVRGMERSAPRVLWVDLSRLEPGQHRIDFERAQAQSAGLLLSLPDADEANSPVANLFVASAAVPERGDSRVTVTYPLHGQCTGSTAQVRGFVRVGRGTPQLKLDDARVPIARDGSFEWEVPVPKGSDSSSWRAVLRLKDGASVIEQRLRLGPCSELTPTSTSAGGPEPDLGAPFAEWVTPAHGGSLSFAGASLEIPPGAVDKPTQITIRPLTKGQVPPMTRSMFNVTPEGRAYRLGPHGLKFKKPIKLKLPIDAQQLPPGLGAEQVDTFYFDATHGRWVKIGRMQTDGLTLTSLTDHFTDFVNATIAMPDKPGPRSFNSNDIKDLEVASPSAGVSLIRPPEAGPTGSAQLSHPLELPPGRNGLRPELAIRYDSDSKNGWLGVGWNLQISSIEVDTRFGVPRYQGDESYSIDGDLLVREAGSDSRYRRRVEGAFDQIERRGSGASDYYWVVTNKSGTQFVYGETASARLADPTVESGPISKWYLERVRDAFGNEINYEYREDRFTEGAEFVQIYPAHIHYTSHEATQLAPAYHVDFVLEGEEQGGAPDVRSDPLLTGRSGFLVATRYLLGRVDIRLGESELIRSYDLEYAADADFDKSLLESIALHGVGTASAPGDKLYSHDFDYYKAPRDGSGNVVPFEAVTDWGDSHRENDGLSRTEDSSGGGSAGGGIGIGPISLTASGGGFLGSEKRKVSFFDAAGNALPSLMDAGGNTSFNELRASGSHFQSGDFDGLWRDALGHTSRSGWMVEGGLHVSGVGVGVSYTRSNTEDDKIVSDINGDGFSDLVSAEDGTLRVRLNTGRKEFTSVADWNPPELDLTPTGLTDYANDPDVQAAFHAIDPLLRWSAPFAGQVTISGELAKLQAGGDGVVAELFHNGQRLWQHAIGPDDTSVCVLGPDDACSGGGISVFVNAGDRIYTKLNGNLSQKADVVSWSPSISYQVSATELELLEPYGAPIYHFSHAADHRLAGKPEVRWQASSQGTVLIGGDVVKLATADEVTVEITRHRPAPLAPEVLLSHTLSANADSLSIGELPVLGQPLPDGLDVAILPDESLSFRLLSDSPIDPNRVAWTPVVTYRDYCRVDPDNESAHCDDVVCGTDDEGQLICGIENDPVPDIPLPPSIISQPAQVFSPAFQFLPAQPTKSYVVPVTGSLGITGTITKAISAAPVTVLIQGVNQLLGKWKFDPLDVGVVPIDFNAFVTAGEQLFFSVISEQDPTGSAALSVAIDGTDLDPATVNVRYLDPSFEETIPFTSYPTDSFSGGYHRWHVGFYNGDVDFDESLLLFPEASDNSALDLATPWRQGLAEVPEPLWLTGVADSFVGATLQKPSRVGASASYQAQPGEPRISGLRKAETYNVDFQASAGISVGYNTGASTSNLDFIDMNGDRYPDSVANDGVSLNDGVSGFAERLSSLAMPTGAMRRSEHRTARAGVSVDGSLINQTDTENRTQSLLATGVNIGIDYGFSSTRKDLVDINGDGLPDHVSQGDGQLTVRLNLGYRFSDPVPWTSAGWQNTQIDAGEVQNVAGEIINAFSDVTSTDTLRLQDTGGRTVGAGISSDVFGVGGSVGVTYTVGRSIADLVDLNGDGLVDQVMKDPSEEFLRVKLNRGDSFGPEERWMDLQRWNAALSEFDPENYLFLGSAESVGFRRSKSYNGSFSVEVCFIACVKASGFYSNGNGFSQLGFEDINGDGLQDHVAKLDGDRGVYAKLNRVEKVNLLKRVQRPLGGSFTLRYEREGNEVKLAEPGASVASVDMPHNQWVLAEVAVDDGGLNPAYVRTFRHRRGEDTQRDPTNLGTGFFDRVEREDYGYALTIMTREDASEVETRSHNQDYYRKHLVTETIERDLEGQLYTRHTFQYREPEGIPIRTGSFFPAEEQRARFWYEGTTDDPASPGKSTSETRQWDERGNLTELVNFADQGSDDDLTYTIGYHFDASSNITKADLVEARDQNGSLLRRREAVIDGTTGALLFLTNTVTGGVDPETETAYNEAAATWSFDYDAYGNVTSITDPLGTPLYYEYDDFAETYRVSISDAFGYTSTSSPDYRFGDSSEVTDINGHTTRFEYDAFGRLERVFGPNDENSTPTVAMSYGLTPNSDPFPAWARTAHKDVTHSEDPELVTVTFADGLDRIIQTKKDLERDTGEFTEVGMSVSGRMLFDERGRLVEQGQPIFDQGAEVEFVDVPMKHPTLRQYDILSRVTLLATPDQRAAGGLAETITDYEFGEIDGNDTLATRTMDPLGNERVVHRDVTASAVAVEEFNVIDNEYRRLLTRYAYNPVGELTSVTDALGNVTTAAYDTLGRMVELDSPDSGVTEFGYDLAGNLAVKQTSRLRAAGQRIRYLYTNNRLDRIDFPVTQDVVYSYGPPDQTGDAFANVAGRIVRESSEAGTKDLGYDRLGNIIEETHTFERIRVPQQDPYSATMRYQYDSLGRLLLIQFPGEGAEEVTYLYDRGGLVARVYGVNTEQVGPPGRGPTVTSYVDHIGYDEFEQRVRLRHGNGVETLYAYEPDTRRLASIEADHLDPELQRRMLPPRPFQRLRYDYDLVGNITEIRNDAPFDDAMHPGVVVATTSQAFNYDNLYQLTGAEGLYQDESKERYRYSLSFEYDDIGNILAKDQASFRDLPNPDGTWTPDQPNQDQTYQATYAYQGSRPRAATHVDEALLNGQVHERELSYDANGNQSGWVYHHSEVREIDWTEEDRLRELRQQGQKVTRALYDGTGERAIHVSYYGNHETAYAGANLTIRNGVYPTKHIYVNDELIASKLDPSWFPHPPTVYFHNDHLGSAEFASNDEQELTQHDVFFPTGEIWRDQSEGRYQVRRTYRFTGKELDEGANLYYFGARWYDARLSQWNSPDPLLSKYFEGQPNDGVYVPANLGLYTYTANNPVRFLDPNGREIVLVGSAATQRRTLALLQSLSHDTLAIQNGRVIIQKVGTPNSGRELGTILIRRLRHSSQTVSVGLTTGSGQFNESVTRPTNVADARNGNPTDADVTIDTRQGVTEVFVGNPDTGVATGTQDTPVNITLGHELVHAEGVLTGNADFSVQTRTFTDTSGTTRSEMQLGGEFSAVGLGSKSGTTTENQLRREQGQPSRVAVTPARAPAPPPAPRPTP